MYRNYYQRCPYELDLTSAYHLFDLREEVTRQLLSRNIGEGILHEFIDCIVGKRSFVFRHIQNVFPNSPCYILLINKFDSLMLYLFSLHTFKVWFPLGVLMCLQYLRIC